MPATIPSWVNDYWSGYLLALQDYVTASTQLAEGGARSPNYVIGLRDGLARKPPLDPEGKDVSGYALPKGVVLPRSTPAPAYKPRAAAGGSVGVQVMVPPPGQPIGPVLRGLVPGGFPVYEVYASLPLIGGVPFDTAEGFALRTGGGWLQTLERNLIQFTLLGADPGDSREGFRLSGPTGPLARRVAAAVAAGQLTPYPTAYGQSAWYGARTTRGVKLLGQQQLQALGLV